jgi:hypothetical protein
MTDPVTTYLSLTKPTVGADETSWGDLLNGNFDALDALWSVIGNTAFGRAAVKDVGTSGATIPLLSATNTWSAAQTCTQGLYAGTPSLLNPSNMKLAVENATGQAAAFANTTGTVSCCAQFLVTNPSTQLLLFTYLNTSTIVGSVTTTGSSTAYNTTSDETFKDFIDVYDPARAITIIRADPVRDFHWNDRSATPGAYAVGWGAQTSYAVSPDLATPGQWFIPPTPEQRDADGEIVTPAAPGRAAEEGEAGALYSPAAVDQSKRTPYLWAAVSWLLDERDQLKADVTALQAAVAALQAESGS